jgi:hypothetical protein
MVPSSSRVVPYRIDSAEGNADLVGQGCFVKEGAVVVNSHNLLYTAGGVVTVVDMGHTEEHFEVDFVALAGTVLFVAEGGWDVDLGQPEHYHMVHRMSEVLEVMLVQTSGPK